MPHRSTRPIAGNANAAETPISPRPAIAVAMLPLKLNTTVAAPSRIAATGSSRVAPTRSSRIPAGTCMKA
jgi:hypothetical protein